MTPEEISRKAAKEKEKLEKQQVTKPAKVKPVKTYDAFSFYTYRRIYPKGMNFMLWFLLCVPGISMIIAYYLEDGMGVWLLYSGFACIIIFLLRWIIDLSMKLATFNSYKNFRSTLGFKLEGWETLGTFPRQLERQQWSEKTTVEVFLKGQSKSECTNLVKDAIYLFTNAADKQFYEAEMGGDGRKKWTTSSASLKVTGSSDISVIGEIYFLIHVYLRSIQKKYDCISSVKVEFDPNIFLVNPPPSTD